VIERTEQHLQDKQVEPKRKGEEGLLYVHMHGSHDLVQEREREKGQTGSGRV
jgi:hypothetical protein